MTQSALAERVGTSFPQIQKYENGMNRISASRMWDIAAVMEVPVTDKEAFDLVRAYYAIPENQRRKLFDLALVLGEARQIARGEGRARAAGRALRRAINNINRLQDNR
jgi:transcriptional regulator with XRE-family HTH domain